MSEEPEPEARPRISVIPFLEALEYDPAYHLHRGLPVIPAESPEPKQDWTDKSEQPPLPAPSPRVLPWRNYLRAQGKRMGTAGAGVGLLLVGVGLLLTGVVYIAGDVEIYLDCQPKEITTNYHVKAPTTESHQVGNLPEPDLNEEKEMTQGKALPVSWLPWSMFHLIFFPLTIFGCIAGANVCIRKAEEAEVGVPLTAANTGHLPAAETLVRASQMSEPQKESVLLRPARSQSPPEQMLRPAAYTSEQQPEQLVRPAAGQE